MDEDSENESFEMLDNIPFQHVSLSMYYKLANILDPESTLKGNNWKLLAEKLGYSRNDIDVFVSQQTTHGRNTLKLFEHYAKKQGSTVNEVYKALEEIERPDALSVLKSGIREIEKTYQESKRRKTRHHELVENTYDFSHDGMSYVNEGYGSFPQGHHKNMMPSCNTYGMYHANYPIPGSAPVGKPFTRHKSHDPPCTSPALPGYKHSSPDFKRQRSMPLSDSMMVRGRDGHSQYMRDVEPMEMSPSIRDDPVPPALAMMRGLPHYNNIHGMPPGVSSIVNSKNPESMFRQPYGGQYKRQTERAGLKLEIPNAGEMYCRQRSADFCSPSPTPTTPSTPLGQLQKLANERTFQPEDGYKDLMKMKMEEEHLQGKIGQNVDGAVKMEYVAQQGVSICDSGRHSDDSSQMSRSRMVGPPNTYPLRLKSTGSCTSSSPTNSSHQLTKSASLPSNMKPAEFRKAFRHIKVFVTYSADDRKHIQRVLGLCKCLEKNGFTCCVDIFHRKLPLEERHGWYQDRFEEADFILVVMSPKYRIEADSCEMENDADDSDSIDSDGDNDVDDRPHRLHTKNIYRLMYREYVQNGERCMRFVPLVFPGMNEDIIPPWMLHAYNRLFYYWPKQYKDLLWMLTKPENRVPEHISLPVNRCSSDTDNNLSTEQSEPCLETD